MYAANRLPRTMVLSIRYQTFMPHDRRNSDMWKAFTPEARGMADRLGRADAVLAGNPMIRRGCSIWSRSTPRPR
jgi:hypothetical protein